MEQEILQTIKELKIEKVDLNKYINILRKNMPETSVVTYAHEVSDGRFLVNANIGQFASGSAVASSVEEAENKALIRAFFVFGSKPETADNSDHVHPEKDEEDSLRTFKDKILKDAQASDSVENLHTLWNKNLGKLDNIKESHPAVYKTIKEFFTTRKSDIVGD